MKQLREIAIKERDRQAVEKAAEVLRARLPVERVILFGSKARGDDDPESDIDLLLLTRRRLTWEDEGQIVELLSPVQMEYEVLFSTVEIQTDDWFEGVYLALPFRAEVERDGVAV